MMPVLGGFLNERGPACLLRHGENPGVTNNAGVNMFVSLLVLHYCASVQTAFVREGRRPDIRL